jgi:hypothetical protein
MMLVLVTAFMKTGFVFTLALLTTLLGAGCVNVNKIENLTKRIAPSSTTQTIPDGWQLLTNEQYGIQAIVPKIINSLGCKQPVKFDTIRGTFGVGALLTPCAKEDARFDDVFAGYTIGVLEGVHSADEIQMAFYKTTNGYCQMNIIDLDKNEFEVTAPHPSANQWAPSTCDLLNGDGELRGFYNPKTNTFLYWKERENSFPIGQGQYADDQVQISPLN